MTTQSRGQGAGGDILTRRNGLVGSRKSGPVVSDILVIEDENMDADRLCAALHLMLGYSIELRRAKTLGSALDLVIARKPHVVFLDDYLKPNDNATHTIPFLRRCGYDGPIIVVSGQVTRIRRAQLMKAGAVDVIHKDDVDSARLAEALTNAGKANGPA